MKRADTQAARFKELLEQMEGIRASKNADYATEEDSMSNFRACEQMGIPAYKGVLIRLTDKFSRIIRLSSRDGVHEVKDESITDTLLDMAIYCLLCIILFEEWKEKNTWRKLGRKPVNVLH